MRCINSQKKITRFVQTYINFLTKFQISCLHHIKKHFPEPKKIEFNDSNRKAMLSWHNGYICLHYLGLTYGATSGKNGMAGATGAHLKLKDAINRIDELKDFIKP